jgi:NAD-dependent SIR2 family protein deacetylase
MTFAPLFNAIAGILAAGLTKGAKVILLNKGETPYDDLVHLKISGNAGVIVPKIVEKVRILRNI